MTITNEFIKDLNKKNEIKYLLKENKQRQRRLKKEIRKVEEDIISITIFNGNRLDKLKDQLQTVEMLIERIEKEEN